MMCSIITVAGMAATWLNGLWSGSDPIGCVSYSLCAYVWGVAACWNMSVLCWNSLSEDVAKLCSTV